MSLDNRSILVTAEFGSMYDPLVLLVATAGIEAQRNRGHGIGECGVSRAIQLIAVAGAIAVGVKACFALREDATLQ
jgi:hypothetical protein